MESRELAASSMVGLKGSSGGRSKQRGQFVTSSPPLGEGTPPCARPGKRPARAGPTVLFASVKSHSSFKHAVAVCTGTGTVLSQERTYSLFHQAPP